MEEGTRPPPPRQDSGIWTLLRTPGVRLKSWGWGSLPPFQIFQNKSPGILSCLSAADGGFELIFFFGGGGLQARATGTMWQIGILNWKPGTFCHFEGFPEFLAVANRNPCHYCLNVQQKATLWRCQDKQKNVPFDIEPGKFTARSDFWMSPLRYPRVGPRGASRLQSRDRQPPHTLASIATNRGIGPKRPNRKLCRAVYTRHKRGTHQEGVKRGV